MSIQSIEEAKAYAAPRTFAFGTSMDAGIAIRVQYIGAQDSGTLTISGVTWTFLHGVLGAEVADTSIGVPTKNGVITVSNASADTAKEVADAINASPNWRCFLEAALPDSNMNASTGSILDMVATQMKVDNGYPLYWDGSKTNFSGVAITGHEFINTNENDGKVTNGEHFDEGCVNEVDHVDIQITFTGTAPHLKIYESEQSDSSATELYDATLVTNTAKELNGTLPSMPFKTGTPGHRIIVWLTAAGTSWDSCVKFDVQGKVIDYSGVVHGG